MIQIKVNTRRAVVTNKELLTVGSAGIQVQFTLSEDWDTLSKLAVFRVGDDGTKVDVVLGTSLTCVVPPEVLTQEGEVLFIGIYGTNGQGTVIIPTVWASAGVVKPGTEPNTPATAEPTQVIWEQILGVAQDAEQVAGEAYTMAENAQGYADAANAAATRASSAANQANNARGSAQSSASQASASASMAANSALQASASAETASNAAMTAITKAGEASTSATAAGNAQTAAEAAQTAAEAAAALLQPAATSADVGKALIVKTVSGGKATAYEYGDVGGGAVNDVQIDGNSIVSDGVADIPLATAASPGLSYPYSNRGLSINADGQISVTKASDNSIKAGSAQYAPIVPSNQHGAAFYGLAKAAGDVTQAASDDPVGTYTDNAKSAIKDMIGATAGGIGFDDSDTYPSGSIGAEVSNQKNAISQLDGGTTGQFLVKSSNTDYDFGWVTVPSANGVNF